MVGVGASMQGVLLIYEWRSRQKEVVH